MERLMGSLMVVVMFPVCQVNLPEILWGHPIELLVVGSMGSFDFTVGLGVARTIDAMVDA